MIRGACPSLQAPMPSGDGLLVRMTIHSTLSLETFAALCAAARRHGNGVMEITARGNLQIRGLTKHATDAFAADVMALGINPPTGVPITISPLAGLEGDGTIDVTLLAQRIADAAAAITLDPKDAEAFLWLGLALRKQNKDADARQAFAKSVTLNPQRVWAKQQLDKTP